MNLTPKQEKFVQGLIKGLSQIEAYKQAYNCENMKDNTIYSRACRLQKEYKISARYQELLNEHKEKTLWTREQAVHDLIWLKEQSKQSIVENGLKQANSNAFYNAIKELNQLENMYNPDKEKLLQEKLKAETDHIKQKTKLIKGVEKDTSMLEALINVVNEND